VCGFARIPHLNLQESITTGDTALRLSKAFGTTPEFWINLQSPYELERARDAAGDLSISPLHAA
jgi:addiction module HigA family antidote